MNPHVIFLPFSVMPASESVHIGISDIKYTSVDQSTRAEMAQCLILRDKIPIGFDLDISCATQIYGRYIYISLIRENSDPGRLRLNEIRVFMGKYRKSIIVTS